MLPTIRLQRFIGDKARESKYGDTLVIEGAFSSLKPYERKVDVFFFDTPSVDADCSLEEYAAWLSEQFQAIERWRAKDCALILCPTDRKGHPWSKSVSTAHVAELFDWQLFRHFVWLKQEADFHRAQYAFQDVWVYRKGNKGAIPDAPTRYKDVVRIVSPHDEDSHVGVIPTEVVTQFLKLVSRPNDVVMDPFAGRGSVMQACAQLNLKSISVELDPLRAEHLRELAVRLEEGE